MKRPGLLDDRWIGTVGFIITFTLFLAGCGSPSQAAPAPPRYVAPTALPPPPATQTPIYVVIEPTERSDDDVQPAPSETAAPTRSVGAARVSLNPTAREPASDSGPASQAPPVFVPTAVPTAAPTAAPTAVPTAAPTTGPVPGSIASYVFNITPTARQIYLAGLARGNRANVFSMVGDSITHSWYFMAPIGEGLTQLHDYGYLQPVIDYYSVANARIDNSFSNPSLAMHFGWTSFDVLNPANGEPGCAGRSPLVCELEVVRPAVAIILIGSNDSTAPTALADYQRNLDEIVQTTIDYGVVPVLSTIPYNTYADTGPYSQAVLTIAAAYDVPWVDFRALMDAAPSRGLGEEGMHPSVPPDNNPANFSADNLQYGYTLRNLLTVQALYAVWSGAMY